MELSLFPLFIDLFFLCACVCVWAKRLVFVNVLKLPVFLSLSVQLKGSVNAVIRV